MGDMVRQNALVSLDDCRGRETQSASSLYVIRTECAGL